jgi:hypothetical protein
MMHMRSVLRGVVIFGYAALGFLALAVALFAWILRDGLGPDSGPDSTGWLALVRFFGSWVNLLYHLNAHWLLAALVATHVAIQTSLVRRRRRRDR